MEIVIETPIIEIEPQERWKAFALSGNFIATLRGTVDELRDALPLLKQIMEVSHE